MKERKVGRVDSSIPGPENIKSKGQRLACAWHDEGQHGGWGGGEGSRRKKGRRMGDVAAGNKCPIRHPSGLAGGRTLASFLCWVRWEPGKGWSRIALAASWEVARGQGRSQGREKGHLTI